MKVAILRIVMIINCPYLVLNQKISHSKKNRDGNNSNSISRNWSSHNNFNSSNTHIINKKTNKFLLKDLNNSNNNLHSKLITQNKLIFSQRKMQDNEIKRSKDIIQERIPSQVLKKLRKVWIKQMYPIPVRKKGRLFRTPAVTTTIISWKVHLLSRKIRELATILTTKEKDHWEKINNHTSNNSSSSSSSNNNLNSVRAIHLFHQNQRRQQRLVLRVILLLRIIYRNNRAKMNHLLANHQ